jgi:hypothetical protein
MITIEEVLYVDVKDDGPMAIALSKMLIDYMDIPGNPNMNLPGYGLLLGEKDFEGYFDPKHRPAIQKVIDSVESLIL